MSSSASCSPDPRDLHLQQSVDLLRIVMDSVPDAVLIASGHGSILATNRQAQDMLGWESRDIIGSLISNHFIAPSAVDSTDPKIHRVNPRKTSAQSSWTELIGKHRSGAVLRVEVTTSNARLGEEEIVTWLVRDLSERSALERELSELREELALADRASTMMVMGAAIAHELNQPIAASSNYIALVQAIAAQQPELSDLAVAAHGLERQNRRTSQILQRMRSFTTRKESEFEWCHMKDIMSAACELVFVGAYRKIQIVTSLSKSVDQIWADPIQTEQVVVNLLRNAAEAIIDLENPRIAVSVHNHMKHGVEVAIADNGPGLADAARVELFHPMRSRKPGGMGVGTAIARLIVEAHGGTIWAECPDGGGTIVRFRLPSFQALPT